MTFNEARIRNLLIKIFKAYELDGKILTNPITEEEVKSKLYFKESDICNSKLLVENDGNYSLSDIAINKICTFISWNKQYVKRLQEQPELEEQFKLLYNDIKASFEVVGYDHAERLSKIKRAIQIANILHWKYMPLFSEQMIINRGIIPEDNVLEYYNHFHALEDLYKEMVGEGMKHNTTEGDINLGKELKFRVYTTRWGHDDVYRVKRTIDGWYVEHISINGPSDKRGVGALKANLSQDSVKYYEDGVESALELLWNDADSTPMPVEELQTKLQEIADWISAMEKATRDHQPEWSIC